MAKSNTHSQFEATILQPSKSGPDDLSAFIILPKSASEFLPRRGRTSVDVSMNDYDFEATPGTAILLRINGRCGLKRL